MDNEEEACVWVRRALLLDVGPAHPRLRPSEKCVVVVVGHGGGIEEPLIFRLPECERLVSGMLACMCHHGHELAQHLYDTYYIDRNDGDDNKYTVGIE